MLRKKLTAGVAVLIGAQLIAVACYVSYTRYCPNEVNLGTTTCSLYSGSTIPWVVNGASSGNNTAQSDGTPHCEYQCSNGSGYTYFWAYPGASPAGGSCSTGGYGY